MSCIFCKSPAANSSTNHILPASLGGEDWACLPDGVVCSKCNQYFGQKIEKLALNSYPFLPFRVLLGIPTRKGVAPMMETTIGTVRGDKRTGILKLKPRTKNLKERIKQGKNIQMTIPAEPSEPLAVCRMLVKMGLEVVAVDSHSDALSSKFDSARTFARCPARGMEWWFFIFNNHKRLLSKFYRGISKDDWINGVSLSIHQFDEFEAFRLQLLDMIIFTPLDGNVLEPAMKEFPPPDHLIFSVKN